MMTGVFKSRFNKYLLALIATLELIVLLFIIMVSYQTLSKIETFADLNFYLSFLLICVASAAIMGFYLIQFYVKTSPKIVIRDQEISIGSRTINFQDIAAIDLFSRSKRRQLRYNEASAITLEDGTWYEIIIDHYANGNLIRNNLGNLNKFLQREASHFQVTTKLQKPHIPSQFNEQYVIYRRSVFKSFMTYFWAVGMIGTVALFQVAVQGFGPFIASLLICSFFYIMAARSTHYFLLSDKYLAVKNLLLPWKQKIIPLADICTVEKYYSPRTDTSLRIVSKDYVLYQYPSGLIGSSLFESLISEIRTKQNMTEEEVPAATELA